MKDVKMDQNDINQQATNVCWRMKEVNMYQYDIIHQATSVVWRMKDVHMYQYDIIHQAASVVGGHRQEWLVCWFMVFNTTFNTISVISWRSVLLVEET
jgi:uncharacterized DUF497 family protein